MATGAPDWQGLIWRIETSLRPNSINTSGRVIFFDDFERAALNWTSTGSAGGSAVTTTTNALIGAYSAYIVSNATIGDYWIIRKYVPFPKAGKYGLETQYSASSTTNDKVRFDINLSGSTKILDFGVEYNPTTDAWQYYDSAGNWTDIPSCTQALFFATSVVCSVKLIVDYNTGKYVQLVSNGEVFDISSLSGKTTSSAGNQLARIDIRATSIKASAAAVMYIDNVVVTEE